MKTKKSKIANIDDVMDDLSFETEIYSDIEEQKEEYFSKEKFLSFSFNLELEKVKFFRDFVVFKRNSNPAFFHYNNSSAIREGIELLQLKNPKLKRRPSSVKISSRFGTMGRLNGIVKLKTSYWINEFERDFIYNFIYAESLSNPDYNKSSFIDDIIDVLKTEYPKMKQERA